MTDTDKRPALDVVREVLTVLREDSDCWRMVDAALASLPRIVDEARAEAGPRLTARMLVEACAAVISPRAPDEFLQREVTRLLVGEGPGQGDRDGRAAVRLAAVLDPTGSLRAELRARHGTEGAR